MLASLNFGNVNTAVVVYSVPTLKQTSFSVNVNNRNTSSNANGGVVKVRLALTSGGAPDAAGANWIEYDAQIGPNSSFERTGLVMLAGQALVAQTDTLGVAVQVYGFEEFTASNLAMNASVSGGTDLDSGLG